MEIGSFIWSNDAFGMSRPLDGNHWGKTAYRVIYNINHGCNNHQQQLIPENLNKYLELGLNQLGTGHS